MAIFGKWKEKAEQLEKRVEELQAFQAQYSNIVDAEATAREIIAEANRTRDDARRKYQSAKLVAEDLEKKAQQKTQELQARIHEQQEEIEKDLQTLGILGIRVMLVEDLDIDPKVALRESETDLQHVKADLDRVDVPEAIEVEYRFEFNQSKAEGRKFQNQIKRLAKLAFDGQCRNVIRTITANNGNAAEEKNPRFCFEDQQFHKYVGCKNFRTLCAQEGGRGKCRLEN